MIATTRLSLGWLMLFSATTVLDSSNSTRGTLTNESIRQRSILCQSRNLDLFQNRRSGCSTIPHVVQNLIRTYVSCRNRLVLASEPRTTSPGPAMPGTYTRARPRRHPPARKYSSPQHSKPRVPILGEGNFRQRWVESNVRLHGRSVARPRRPPALVSRCIGWWLGRAGGRTGGFNNGPYTQASRGEPS